MRFESSSVVPGEDGKPAVEVRTTEVRESFREGSDFGSNRFCRLFETTRSLGAQPGIVPEAAWHFCNV